MSKTRKLHYYFGRNEKYDYPAVPMQSCIVAGWSGAGKSTFLNSLLVKVIQETNPNELCIYWYDFASDDASIWVDSVPSGKYIPQFKEIHQYVTDDGKITSKMFDEFEDALANLYELVNERVRECEKAGVQSYKDVENKQHGTEDIIFLINEYQRFCNVSSRAIWFNQMISKILYDADRACVHLLLLSQSSKDSLSGETIYKFPIRIVTPVSEDVSNLFIGCNLASMSKEQYGVIWVREGNSYPYRLYVPFYPDTWIRKFIGYYSIKKQYFNNKDVTD